MTKIAFMGAGSTVFAKNVLGDCMCSEALKGSTIALYDIDHGRLDDSRLMLSGITPTFVGDLPEACAALNRTNIDPQILTVEAVLTGKKEAVYQAALLDPHTSAELSIADTISLCDDLFKAHGTMIPKLR